MTIAGSASGANGAPADRISRATSPAPVIGGRASKPGAAAVHPEDDLGVQDPHERVEITGPGSRQERIDNATLDRHVRIRAWRTFADAATGATRQLAGGRGRLAHDIGDLVERDGKHVVQDEREAFGGCQGLEHDEQGDPDGIGKDDVVLGALVERDGHDRLRQPAPGVVLASRPARPEHVQADPADDHREPATKVIGASRVAAIEPDPCLLDGIVGLADRAEHPVGDAAQVRTLVLELLGQPVASVQSVTPRSISRVSLGVRISRGRCDSEARARHMRSHSVCRWCT